jgi:hypothetical protein
MGRSLRSVVGWRRIGTRKQAVDRLDPEAERFVRRQAPVAAQMPPDARVGDGFQGNQHAGARFRSRSAGALSIDAFIAIVLETRIVRATVHDVGRA